MILVTTHSIVITLLSTKIFCKFISLQLITILRLGFILLWILFFNPIRVRAQLSYSFHSIDVSRGLRSNVVTSLAQDERGYMWVGTGNGIQCYDMYEFIEERAFSGYDRIYVDRRGRKWMGGSWGVDLYEEGPEKVKHVQVIDDSTTFNIMYPRWIYEDSERRVWLEVVFVTGETKYFYFDEVKDRFFPYDSLLPSIKGTMRTVSDLGDRNFWIGTADGLVYYDHKAKCYRYPNDPKFPLTKFPKATDPIHSLHSVGGGNMIIIIWSNKPWSSPHLYLVDEKGSILLDYLSSGDVQDVIVDNNKNIWIAGDRLLRIDRKSRAVEPVALPESNGRVNAISLDREGNIWLGTQHGILVFEPDQRFEDRENVSVDGARYRGETLSLLQTHDSIVVAGTWGGNHLYFYDKNLKPLAGFDGFTKAEFADLVVPVWSLLESSDHSIWIGGQHGNLFRIDRKSKKLEKFDRRTFKLRTIRSIHEDFQHNVWFSIQGGAILKRDGRSGIISDFGQYSLHFALFINDNELLWASTGANLLKINPATGSLEKYTMKLGKPRDNLIVRLFKILEVTLDRIILNSSEGLVEFNKTTKEFKMLSFNTSYFKPETVINNYLSIETIGKGRYVATLESGEIVRNENQLINGLMTKNSFVANSSLKLTDGRFIFGSETGFTVVKPSFISRSLRSFQAPSINAIFLQNRAVNVDSVIRFGLTVNYDQSYFSVAYSALLLREKENVRYFYRMDESAEFINNGHSRRISYGGLSPGKHRLDIFFSTGGGKSPITSISIKVIPPFWATWWFMLISAAATLSIFILIYRIRINKIKELARVKEKIARDIHDEMGSNISTIGILSSVLKDKLKQTSSLDKESQILEKIGRLSTEAMEAASEIVWSVNPKNDSMKEVARRMRLTGSQLEDFGINFSFIVEGDMSERELSQETRNDFYLIYKEIITNIAKHSKCKNVSVVINFGDEFGEMIIQDDGIGFNVEKDSSGNGLKNMMARVKKMTGNLSIESKVGLGTITKIQFPL